MRAEIAAIDDDGAALAFALGCLWSGCASRMKGEKMSNGKHGALRPGMTCAAGATLLGLIYLAMAGAPAPYLIVNLAAFVMGIGFLFGILAIQRAAGPGRVEAATGPVLMLLASGLLATALLGAAVDGAARWVWVGPIGVQVSLVLVPVMAILFARRAEAVGAAAMIVTAVALALQPDRAMAGVLAASLVVTALVVPSRFAIVAAIAATAGFAGAMAQADALAAVPFVDRILYTGFAVHPLAGAAVLIGALLLVVPAILGWRVGGDQPAWLAFGAAWAACLLAAALGNYPTPVVGYGGSAILGYLLSLGAATGTAPARSGSRLRAVAERTDSPAPLRKRAMPA